MIEAAAVKSWPGVPNAGRTFEEPNSGRNIVTGFAATIMEYFTS